MIKITTETFANANKLAERLRAMSADLAPGLQLDLIGFDHKEDDLIEATFRVGTIEEVAALYRPERDLEVAG